MVFRSGFGPPDNAPARPGRPQDSLAWRIFWAWLICRLHRKGSNPQEVDWLVRQILAGYPTLRPPDRAAIPADPEEEVMSATVVILTALEVEYTAVRAHLTGLRDDIHASGTVFETGTITGTSTKVTLGLAGEGNQAAAVLAERAMAWYRPVALFVTGIAGALHPDLDLGDVVVATRIYAYQGGREEPEEFLARPRAWDAPYDLEQLARRLARTAWWTGPQSGDDPTPGRIHFRPIAAGEVVLNSRTTPVARRLRLHYNDAAAIEMESAGAPLAAHLNRSTRPAGARVPPRGRPPSRWL
jgi:nucleoside phosphorylase